MLLELTLLRSQMLANPTADEPGDGTKVAQRVEQVLENTNAVVSPTYVVPLMGMPDRGLSPKAFAATGWSHRVGRSPAGHRRSPGPVGPWLRRTTYSVVRVIAKLRNCEWCCPRFGVAQLKYHFWYF